MTRFLLLLIFLNVDLNLKAQDPHFSQYRSSPLTLNPALTGSFDGDSRFAATFRHQWNSIGNPFVTGTASFDTKLMPVRMGSNTFGFGIYGLYDQSLDGGFKNSNIAASLSFLKSLDEGNKNRLGLGFQLTFASRFINTTKLDFGNQFTGYGFDNGLPSNENFSSLQREYFDINTGLYYSYNDRKVKIDFGASLFHITKPNISFLKNNKYELPQRYVLHSSSRILLGENSNELNIGALYMFQEEANEINLEAAYGIRVNNQTMVKGGVSYRLDDAIIPFVGVNYNNINFGVSYDINNSSLGNYTKNGSLEVSIMIFKNRK